MLLPRHWYQEKPSFPWRLSLSFRDALLPILFNYSLHLLGRKRLSKSSSKNQNAPFSDQLASGFGEFQPETVAFDGQPEFVSRQKIELIPNGLWQHHASGLIHLNHFRLHG